MPKVELKNKRKPHVKHYQLEGNQYQVSIRKTPFHYNDGRGLADIDLTPSRSGRNYIFDKCPHTLQVRDNQAQYRFVGTTGTVTVTLDSVGATKITGTKTPTWDGTRFLWADIATDVDYEVIPTNSGVQSYIILKSASAAKTIQWSYSGSNIFRPLRGFDAAGLHCQLNTTITTNSVSVTWTGNVGDKKVLRTGGWGTNATYPVRIDPSINESIATGADDGETLNNTQRLGLDTIAMGMSSSYEYWAGFRFQTVAIPQGSTIDSATITFEKNALQGSPQVRFYADDVDDAAAWATTSRIKNITKTTAFQAWSPTVATGTEAVNVQSIVQEIVDRGGWASNNDMRFGVFDQRATTAQIHFVCVAAVEHATQQEAQLDVTYTAAGGSTLVTGKGLTDPNFINPRSLVR